LSRSCRRERDVAIDAVRRASAVCRQVQSDLVTAQAIEKKDRSPVTIADFASQAIVSAVLGEACPDDPLVGEEEAAALRSPERAPERRLTVRNVGQGLGRDVSEDEVLRWIDRGAGPCPASGRFWTVDPIDGTKGFLRGGQYAVALALIEDGRVVLAVLGCPNLPGEDGAVGQLLAAVEGAGTTCSSLTREDAERPVRVRPLRDPAQARLIQSVESSHSDHGSAQRIAGRLAMTSAPERMDSQAKYAAVACGDADVYLRLPTRPSYREWIWDHAAGGLIVTEAGGTVTDVEGKPLDFGRGRKLAGNRGVVAASADVHAAVLAAVRAELQ
jgi:3'(2'), 5'-bisphosphate nucleotidase